MKAVVMVLYQISSFKVGTTPESDGMGKGKDYIDFAKDGFDAYETVQF